MSAVSSNLLKDAKGMTLKKPILFPGENFGHEKIYICLNSWSSRERD